MTLRSRLERLEQEASERFTMTDAERHFLVLGLHIDLTALAFLDRLSKETARWVEPLLLARGVDNPTARRFQSWMAHLAWWKSVVPDGITAEKLTRLCELRRDEVQTHDLEIVCTNCDLERPHNLPHCPHCDSDKWVWITWREGRNLTPEEASEVLRKAAKMEERLLAFKGPAS